MRSQKFLWSIRHVQTSAGGDGTSTARADADPGPAGGLGVVGGTVGAVGPTGVLGALGGGGGLQARGIPCWTAGGAMILGGG